MSIGDERHGGAAGLEPHADPLAFDFGFFDRTARSARQEIRVADGLHSARARKPMADRADCEKKKEHPGNQNGGSIAQPRFGGTYRMGGGRFVGRWFHARGAVWHG